MRIYVYGGRTATLDNFCEIKVLIIERLAVPENTLLSFYTGLSMGENGIETDVQRTKDGILVLFHHDTITRVTGQEGSIADYTFEELQSFRVRRDCFEDRIVSLEEFLRLFGWRDLTFAIELKVEGVAEEVADLIRKYGIEEKAIVTSFKFDYIKAQSPDQFRKNNHFSQVFIVFCPAI
jgi:glycerophosphoryl diester phosphodiesterase